MPTCYMSVLSIKLNNDHTCGSNNRVDVGGSNNRVDVGGSNNRVDVNVVLCGFIPCRKLK